MKIDKHIACLDTFHSEGETGHLRNLAVFAGDFICYQERGRHRSISK